MTTEAPATTGQRLRDDFKRTLFEGEVLESTLVGIALAKDLRLLWVNGTFARMLGYEREELIGQHSSLLYPDGKSFEAFGAAAYPLIKPGDPYVTEQQMRRKDGSLIWVQISGKAVDPNDPDRGSVSIRNGVERMTKMLDNVLTIGKAEANMLEFSPAPTDLHAFCTRLAGEMQLAAGDMYALEFSYEGPRAPVSVDEKLLLHALTNLMSNAVKYSPDGGKIEFQVRVAARDAVFEVNDQVFAVSRAGFRLYPCLSVFICG